MVTARGVEDAVGIRSALAALPEDALFQPRFRVLFDARGLEISPTIAEVRAMVKEVTDRQEQLRGRIAVVVEPGPLYDLAELGARLARDQGSEARCFGSPDAARDWLAERNG